LLPLTSTYLLFFSLLPLHCTISLFIIDFDFREETPGTHNTSGTSVQGSQSSSLAIKRSDEESVDHFSFLAVGDAHSQSTSMSTGMGMGMGDALGMSKDNDKERNTAKKNKGVLHGFRSSVFCHKIQSARKSALPLSSSSRPIPSHSSHPQSSDMASNDIDYHYKVAKACLSPLLVKAGFEEIDGIIECGPQAGTGSLLLLLLLCFFFTSVSLVQSFSLLLISHSILLCLRACRQLLSYNPF
jgi:hypothetical protein